MRPRSAERTFRPVRSSTWDKGLNPLAVHQAGDRVRVVVTAIDPEKERISSSIKQLADDPWTRVGSVFVEGGVYEARITRLMAYWGEPRSGEDRGNRVPTATAFVLDPPG